MLATITGAIGPPLQLSGFSVSEDAAAPAIECIPSLGSLMSGQMTQ